jgi:hypothetical protein
MERGREIPSNRGYQLCSEGVRKVMTKAVDQSNVTKSIRKGGQSPKSIGKCNSLGQPGPLDQATEGYPKGKLHSQFEVNHF